jgi:hypothetical protein
LFTTKARRATEKKIKKGGYLTMKPKKQLYEQQITGEIIGAAIEVHRELGPGLLESSYEICLARELELRGISFEFQKPLPMESKSTC